MTKELSWYEVIDLTSYGVKYPNDWYERCGRNRKWWDVPVSEVLGKYSTEENAIKGLRKWADEKGIPFEENSEELRRMYPIFCDDGLDCECYAIVQVGLYYDFKDNQVKRDDDLYCYSTSAIVVRKVITLTLDED